MHLVIIACYSPRVTVSESRAAINCTPQHAGPPLPTPCSAAQHATTTHAACWHGVRRAARDRRSKGGGGCQAGAVGRAAGGGTSKQAPRQPLQLAPPPRPCCTGALARCLAGAHAHHHPVLVQGAVAGDAAHEGVKPWLGVGGGPREALLGRAGQLLARGLADGCTGGRKGGSNVSCHAWPAGRPGTLGGCGRGAGGLLAATPRLLPRENGVCLRAASGTALAPLDALLRPVAFAPPQLRCPGGPLAALVGRQGGCWEAACVRARMAPLGACPAPRLALPCTSSPAAPGGRPAHSPALVGEVACAKLMLWVPSQRKLTTSPLQTVSVWLSGNSLHCTFTTLAVAAGINKQGVRAVRA